MFIIVVWLEPVRLPLYRRCDMLCRQRLYCRCLVTCAAVHQLGRPGVPTDSASLFSRPAVFICALDLTGRWKILPDKHSAYRLIDLSHFKPRIKRPPRPRRQRQISELTAQWRSCLRGGDPYSVTAAEVQITHCCPTPTQERLGKLLRRLRPGVQQGKTGPGSRWIPGQL